MCPLRLLLTCRAHRASEIVWEHTDPLRFESLTPTLRIRRFRLSGRSGRLACDPKHRPGRVPSSVRSVQIDTAISVTTFQGGSPRICTDRTAHELRSRRSTIAPHRKRPFTPSTQRFHAHQAARCRPMTFPRQTTRPHPAAYTSHPTRRVVLTPTQLDFVPGSQARSSLILGLPSPK